MNTNYAGFWKRFLAWFIDKIILAVINGIILAPIFTAIGISSGSGFFPFSDFMDPDNIDFEQLVGTIMAMAGIAMVVKGVVNIAYHSLMESSKFQGSLGKMALSIIVTDLNGTKLDFTRALARNLCKIITDFTFLIGYIIAGFTEKRQALHDIIAGTLVVNK
jgi:uncharacterized RDD family membrane protein YckC